MKAKPRTVLVLSSILVTLSNFTPHGFADQPLWVRDENLLSQGRSMLAATTVGNLALFAGGNIGSSARSDVVDVYDASADSWRTASLSEARSELAATTVGSKAIFAGGDAGDHLSAVVDIFDADTGQWSSASLSEARTHLAATSVGTKALFGGGSFSDRVDIYDSETGQWSVAAISTGRIGLAAAGVGSKAIFAGGFLVGYARTDLVEVFIVPEPASLSVLALGALALIRRGRRHAFKVVKGAGS